MSKPALPQGTRDFGPETVYKRQYIFNTIRRVFELSGYEPLETPAMENLDTLLGKYGDEGDKLLFKILNNGLDHESKREKAPEEFAKILGGKNNPFITERALRYDLTIPFARFVAMNHHNLPTPFKRYQIQPVWRADRPQKGRYREFYQCDADVVGSRSLLNEVELTRIYLTVFEQLKLDVEIRINHRKVLAALAELCGGPGNLIIITTAIDKLDKIGSEKVKEELKVKGLDDQQIITVENYLAISGSNEQKLEQLEKILSSGSTGIEDIRYLLGFFPDNKHIVLDFSLARGLNYYTGVIFEVRAKNVSIGSIGGGGRYDDLTGLFGVPNVPGVGISFGVDRIYDVLEELKLFPPGATRSATALFFNLAPEAVPAILDLMNRLHTAGIGCELFPDAVKFDKQFRYAEKKRIPFAVIIGADELKSGKAKVKNLESSQQTEVLFDDLATHLSKANG